MSEPKFTPGPWVVGETRHAGAYQLVMAASRQRGFVCEVQAPLLNGDHDGETREANARLIAAAPAMYEALKDLKLVLKLAGLKFGFNVNAENSEALRRAEAALLAADGALGASTPGADGEAGSTGSSPDPIPTEGREPNQ